MSTSLPRGLDASTLLPPGTADAVVGGLDARQHAPPLDPGTRLGTYEVIRLLGAGGMGAVYLARDTRLGRKVALKLLRRTCQVERGLLQEARATAQCAHDNIVVIHDIGAHRGRFFLVLEHLVGRPLRALLGEPKPPARVAQLMVPVLRGLACAHDFGFVHQDLKPENIMVCDSGAVKILDFGVARLLEGPEARGVAGTPRYMSPEQRAGSETDHRADLYAVGVMLHELIGGAFPDGTPLVERAPYTPFELLRLVERCLAESPDTRPGSAKEALDILLPFLPGAAASPEDSEAPFRGLVPFRQTDACRFFGREEETASCLTRLEDTPVVALVGPSGAGKSSLANAGVGAALLATGGWEIMSVRPGRHPVAALEALLGSAGHSGHDLREAPGAFGAALRSRARRTGLRLLLLVDQAEELCTLAEAADAECFACCLVGAADDRSAPVRVLLTLRSDFLERLPPILGAALLPGLHLIRPPGRAQLSRALTGPLERFGYRIEPPSLIDHLTAQLENQPGALPLLQVAAVRWWEMRDRAQRVLTRDTLDGLGGITGVLAAHAEEALTGLGAEQRAVARAICRRLVTADKTRAVVPLPALLELSERAARVVEHLAERRLLVVQSAGTETTVELVHEALIDSWPTLSRWLDDTQEHAALFEQLAVAARQWSERGRDPGLLWQGAGVQDAWLLSRYYDELLSKIERSFVSAILESERRSRRRRRWLTAGVIAALIGVVLMGAVALVRISRAEGEALRQAEVARERALEVERKTAEAARAAQAAETAHSQVESRDVALKTQEQVLQTKEDALAAAVVRLKAALKQAERDREKAVSARERAEAATKAAETASTKAAAAEKEALRAAAEEARAHAALQKLLDKERAALSAERKKREALNRRLQRIETGGLR